MLGMWVWSLGWEICWRRKWQPTPLVLPGKSHGQRSLAGYKSMGWQELDTTQQLNHPYHPCAWWSTTLTFSIFPINSTGKVELSKQYVCCWCCGVPCRAMQCSWGTFAAWTALCLLRFLLSILSVFAEFLISSQLFHPTSIHSLLSWRFAVCGSVGSFSSRVFCSAPV